jgi:hypothetical protein
VVYRHQACGEISGAGLSCTHCGERMRAAGVDLLPGPGMPSPEGAGPGMA